MSEKHGKYVSESALDDQMVLVFPNDLNSQGTLFGGRVLELADQLAAIAAMRHAGRVCVTLGLDSVRFLSPGTQYDILAMYASVNRAWHSSMEIGLKTFAEDFRTHRRRHIFSAYFTYVALGEDRKPIPVPPVLPQNPDQRRRYREADIRRERRISQHFD